MELILNYNDYSTPSSHNLHTLACVAFTSHPMKSIPATLLVMIFLASTAIILLATTSAVSDPHQNPIRLKQPVPVGLFVMSKCPDTVFCEHVFQAVLCNVSVPTTLDVNYLGEVDPAEKPFGALCKHGPLECLGNAQELCFRSVYPDVRDWFSFVSCLNRKFWQIGEDGYAEECGEYCGNMQPEARISDVKKTGKDYEPISDCIASGEGGELLRASIRKTESWGVNKSCTMFINNKLRCIHDGEWKDCDGGHKVDDFVRDIEEAY
ncbi:hypothetical protein BC936DRAFT_139582 [Jimgerdemannia flammicorona]|uniref:Uncharacterized protein n=1 Tax=Jimgerdemannia flammicorona TaxID=994334 RepID=A0A433B9L6_9FUNG|nr:hypothetical protein BC936DRAFT_139582 [Jimgerdemannia flammicorona]